LIVLGELFRVGAPMADLLCDIGMPLAHHNTNIRIQASKMVADYICDAQTVGDAMRCGIYDGMIRMRIVSESRPYTLS
jgi:hypothetical protein